MGVAGLWDILRPAAKTRSLTQLAVVEGFQANPDGVRGFRIGIDASIWFFHANWGKEGENPELRTLFFRCATLMRAPFLPLFVFDGPKRPSLKRGKRINTTSHKLTTGMKAIIESYGFEWRTAPGEAEAELAYLNRIGVIDAVLSDDVDNFLFGATMVIRNPSNNLSGNRAHPVMNSEGKDDKNHSMVYCLKDISEHPDISLTRGGLILIGLLSGGDYQQGGLARCGTQIAHALAKCGFGDSLYQAVINLQREQLPTFLSNWRNQLRHELRTDSRGFIGRKHPSLAKSVPEDFPNIDILLSYTDPITSETMGRAKKNLNLTWDKEPDLGKLAATCEFYFEWGYKEAIIKRFRTVIWPSAVLRILRRSILNSERKLLERRSTLLSTPKKPGPEPVGTPSKMIANHFSSLALCSPTRVTNPEDHKPLIVKIHSSRTHTSTDGMLEYRLEIAPAQLVRLAEAGIQGTRREEDPDEWADDYDEDEDPKKSERRSADPATHLRVWIPASVVQLSEPNLVEEFETEQDRKKARKVRKCRTTSSKMAGVRGKGERPGPPRADQSPGATAPAKKATERRDSSKVGDRNANNPGNDLKAFFAVGKPLRHTQKMPQIVPPPPPPAVLLNPGPSAFGPDEFDEIPRRAKQEVPPVPITLAKHRRRDDSAASSGESDELPLVGSLLRDNQRNGQNKYPSQSRLLPALAQPRPFPMSFAAADDPFSDSSHGFSSDPPKDTGIDSTTPKPGLYRTHSRKSPRKSVGHTSPRSQRIISYPDAGANEGKGNGINQKIRPVSPSPLPLVSRPSQVSSPTQFQPNPTIIEISSDSDEPHPPILPLLVVKEKARRKMKTQLHSQPSLKTYVEDKGNKAVLNSTDVNIITPEIIDLT